VFNQIVESNDLTYSLVFLFFFHKDLKALLKTTNTGQSILKCYAQRNCLEQTHRMKMIDEIVEEFYRKSYVIRYADIVIVTSKIIELFPNEEEKTYYTLSDDKNNRVKGNIFDRNKLYQAKIRRIRVGNQAIK
jgi:predicted house-cleaning noncanonical NTP pyrophosphatase (MazG superfamily)